MGYLYVKWIVETSLQIGKDHLMFVARDGYIWKAICEALYPEMKSEYFYAPRLVSIAMLGAIGSVPWAVKDRQEYIDKHLNSSNIDHIRDSYRQYMKKYAIDDKTAMIDGCSSGFSAQRLVEKTIGRNVFCFYLLAMAKIRYAATLYSTQLLSLQWQMLSEFVFGAPENPIRGIDNGLPMYETNLSKEESLKVSVSQNIAEGAVACAKVLKKENVEITPDDWREYVDLFMEYISEEDEKFLTNAMNAPDVEQKYYKQILFQTVA